MTMIASVLLMLLLGEQYRRASDDASKTAHLLIAALALIIALTGGAYWNIFGRGHDFWTANRISAAVLLVSAFLFGRRYFRPDRI